MSKTPWDDAERFASQYMSLRHKTGHRQRSAGIDVLDSLVKGWSALFRFDLPSWLFLYNPHGQGLYEMADNITEGSSDGIARRALGWAKVESMRQDGGLIFMGCWASGIGEQHYSRNRLLIPSYAIVEPAGLFVWMRGAKRKYHFVTADEWRAAGLQCPHCGPENEE